MADTDQAINLMRHAADLLDDADPAPHYLAVLNDLRHADHKPHMANLARVVAAHASAIATLRLVAAALERGTEPDQT